MNILLPADTLHGSVSLSPTLVKYQQVLNELPWNFVDISGPQRMNPDCFRAAVFSSSASISSVFFFFKLTNTLIYDQKPAKCNDIHMYFVFGANWQMLAWWRAISVM